MESPRRVGTVLTALVPGREAHQSFQIDSVPPLSAPEPAAVLEPPAAQLLQTKHSLQVQQISASVSLAATYLPPSSD